MSETKILFGSTGEIFCTNIIEQGIPFRKLLPPSTNVLKMIPDEQPARLFMNKSGSYVIGGVPED